MKKFQTGFTLIELLIVVAIIGILAAIAVPNFLNAQIRAKIANAESEMRSLSTALEMYRLDNNMYPPFVNEGGSVRNPVSTRLNPLTAPISYMSSVPQDPFVIGPGGEIQQPDQAYNTYDYVDAFSFVNWLGRSPLLNSFRCSEWRIASAGPDGVMTFGEVPKYDSSNGIISGGDLTRTGPRASYQCDDSLVGL